MVAKESIIEHAQRTVDRATQATGAQALFRQCPLERLTRDMQAGRFHPPAAPTSMQMISERIQA